MQLEFIEFITEISIRLGSKITGTERGQFARLQTAVRTGPKMYIVKLSSSTLNLSRNFRSRQIIIVYTLFYLDPI
jgi:hypothetical protein